MLAERIRHVVEHRHRVEQGGALEHHPHLLPHLERLLEAERADVLAVDHHAPLVRREQPQEELEDRGLARPRLAEHDDRLPRVGGERHVVEHGLVERQRHALELDDGLVLPGVLERGRARERVRRIRGQRVANGGADARRAILSPAPRALPAVVAHVAEKK